MRLKVFLLSIFYYLLSITPLHAQDPGPNAVGPKEIQAMLQRVISLSAGLVFIALTIMLFYAGLRYITSNGEPKNIQMAHNTVTWAILGIVFLVISWLILRLIEAFTGIPVTQICIGFDCP